MLITILYIACASLIVSPQRVHAVVFPTPTSFTKGWHPLSFSSDYTGKPRQVDFVDTKLVLWKGRDEFLVRADVCPHQGAMLSCGTVNDGCIQCPYHGLNIGPYDNAFNDDCKDVIGKCIEHQGIVWWSRDPTESVDTVPHCADFSENMGKVEHTQLTTTVESSFSDAFKNSMDFHHAAWVHKNTFGNQAGEPTSITERWTSPEQHTLEGEFLYGSNDMYGLYTGGTTTNVHVYSKPSTTYNIVRGNGKFMIIHVAMRAVAETRTMWFLQSMSNFVPPGPLGKFVLDKMVRKVALGEDAQQLKNMAPDAVKQTESFRFQLPLDGIYNTWNDSYMNEQ